ncbi:hypothetical protein NCS52_00953100 [Fusarium sp. LHS14.1]|nr:hypothetical protein NCS52_00953100 [Fusarium sp. LHS14.1]
MTTGPDFSTQQYLPVYAAGASQSQPPPATSSQHIAEATNQYEERASIDSTSSSRMNSIQGHLERLRRRTAFMISGESVIDPIEWNYQRASSKEPVWDWFAMDNVFHRPAPSARGDYKHLIYPLSPKSHPTRDQVELERAVRAYEDRLRPVEDKDAKLTDATANPPQVHSSVPLLDCQPPNQELDKDWIPKSCPQLQPQSLKRKPSGNADGTNEDRGRKRVKTTSLA